MGYNKLLIIGLIFLLIGVVHASTSTVNNFQVTGWFNHSNASQTFNVAGNVSATFYYGDGSKLSGISASGGAWNISGSDWLVNESGVLDWNESNGNSTYLNVGEESGLDVNSSNFWDSFDIPTDLNYRLLLDWVNVTNRVTHLSNLTDDLVYSSKNVNSSNYWDAFDNATLPWLSGSGGNLAWNETKGDADYVDVAGDTLTGALGFNDDVQLQLGSSDDFVCEYDTGQTPDAFWCGLSADSNLWIISEKADTADRAIPLQANPTLAVGSASGTALNFTTLSHDGVDAVLDNLNGGNISLVDDTRVGGNLFVGDSLGSSLADFVHNGTAFLLTVAVGNFNILNSTLFGVSTMFVDVPNNCVSIGDTSCSEELDVAGSVSVSNNLTVSGVSDLGFPMGEAYNDNNTNPTTIDSAGVFVPVNISATFGTGGTGFYLGGQNSLVFNGSVDMHCHSGVTLSVTSAGASDIAAAQIYKNGIPVNGSRISVNLGTPASYTSTAIHVMPVLSPGDNLTLYVANMVDADDLTLSSFNLFSMCVNPTG